MTFHVDHSWSDDPEYNVPLGQGEREAQWCGQFSDEPDNMPRTKNVDRVVGAIEHPPPLLQTRMQLLPCIFACIPRLGARAIPREIGSLTELSHCAAPQCPPPRRGRACQELPECRQLQAGALPCLPRAGLITLYGSRVKGDLTLHLNPNP